MNIVDLPITKRTKAVIFVHLYGYPTDLTSLAENLKKSGIYLIEDYAQAHGAKIGDKHVGTFGDAGCFSFYPTKNLGAIGDAGGIITNSYEVSRKLKSLRSYGVGSSKYNHVDLGMNSRLDPIQASFLISRLANLAEENKSRIRIANEITNSLKSSRIIKPLDRKTTGVDVFHLLVVTYEGDRENFQKKLLDKGVQTDVHYPKAIHQQECYLTPEYSYLKSSNFPVSEYLAASVLSLPIFPWMDQARLSYLTRTLEELNSEKL